VGGAHPDMAGIVLSALVGQASSPRLMRVMNLDESLRCRSIWCWHWPGIAFQ